MAGSSGFFVWSYVNVNYKDEEILLFSGGGVIGRLVFGVVERIRIGVDGGRVFWKEYLESVEYVFLRVGVLRFLIR